MNNTQPQLDPSVVALTKAIGTSESGGNYNAKGKSGEYGAYQYTKPTWEADSQKYLGSVVPLEQATPAQQDEVAYKKVEDLGKQGYKPSQVASIWNSGKPDWEGNVGTNKYGVKYDTPAYVKSVGAAYDKILGGGSANQDPNNPSATVGQPTSTGRKTFVESLPSAAQTGANDPTQFQGSGLGATLGNALINIVPGAKTLGKYFGTSFGGDYTKAKDIVSGTNNYANYDKTIPSPSQVAGATAGFLGTTEGVDVADTLTKLLSLGQELGAHQQVQFQDVATATTSGTAATVGLGGGALVGAGRTTALESPEITQILKQALNPGQDLSTLTRESAIKRLTAKLATMSTSEVGGTLEQQILKAIQELNPTLIEKQSAIKELIKGGISLAKLEIFRRLLGDTGGALLHSVTGK